MLATKATQRLYQIQRCSQQQQPPGFRLLTSGLRACHAQQRLLHARLPAANSYDTSIVVFASAHVHAARSNGYHAHCNSIRHSRTLRIAATGLQETAATAADRQPRQRLPVTVISGFLGEFLQSSIILRPTVYHTHSDLANVNACALSWPALHADFHVPPTTNKNTKYHVAMCGSCKPRCW